MLTKQIFSDVLKDNILDFWRNQMTDSDQGGFYGQITGEGKLMSIADKSIILNARILWTFSAAYPVTKDPNHLASADRAFDYLIGKFFDHNEGGVFWMLDYKGAMKEGKKQIYAQAFAVYALAQYHKIRPERKARHHAIELYHLIEQHSFDLKRNGYFEALDQHWQPLADVRLSEKDMNATKTMNTHLHVMEAYTTLYEIWPNAGLRTQLINLIKMMSTTFVTADAHFKLFFNDTWELQSNEISYGHDIEGGWLLCEAAQVIGDQELIANVNQLAVRMTDAALEGLDKDGGLMNEANSTGLSDTDKHWWPQAESLVGLVNAYHITKEETYLATAESVWNFTTQYLIDPQGEWHWKVNRQGVNDFVNDKAGAWKCPYHNGRAMIEMIKRL